MLHRPVTIQLTTGGTVASNPFSHRSALTLTTFAHPALGICRQVVPRETKGEGPTSPADLLMRASPAFPLQPGAVSESPQVRRELPDHAKGPFQHISHNEGQIRAGLDISRHRDQAPARCSDTAQDPHGARAVVDRLQG